MAEAAIRSVPIAWALSAVPLVVRTVIISMKGKFDPTKPRDRKSQEATLPEDFQPMCVRLLGAHNNQLETLGYYAAGVAVAVACKVPPETLARLSGYYIKSRIAYNFAYAAPQVAGGALRTATFLVGIVSTAMLYLAAAESASNIY